MADGFGHYRRSPQYTGLESGVSFIPSQDYITPAVLGLQQVQQKITEDQLAEVEKKKEAFNKLLEISLKDVKGKWRDEALQTKADALKNIAGMMASDTPLNAGHLIKIQEEKDKLESMMGMAQGIEDWYKTAVEKAATITNEEARNQTVENIRKIMEESGTVSDTYSNILKNDWLIHPPETIDAIGLKKKLLETASTQLKKKNVLPYDQYGVVGFQDMYRAAPEELEGMLQATWNQYEKQLVNSGIKTYDDWKKFVGEGESIGQPQYREMAKGTTVYPPGALNPKNPLIGYSPSVQGWAFGDVNDGKGIPIASMQLKDTQGNPVGQKEDMAITMVRKDADGKYYAYVRVPKGVTVEEAEEGMKNAMPTTREEKIASLLYSMNGSSLAAQNKKDPINSEYIKVDIENVEELILRNVNLQDYFYDPADISGEKYKPASAGQVTPSNPLGLPIGQ